MLSVPFTQQHQDDAFFYNDNKLPFLIVSGRESFSVINLKDFSKHKLIASPCFNIRNQQAFFFKKEEYGYCMHFTTKSTSDDNNLENQKWYMLPFKSDFCSILEKHGRLPTSNLNTKLKKQSKKNRN